MPVYNIKGKKVSVHPDGHIFVDGKCTELKQWQCGTKYSNLHGREQKDLKGKGLSDALYIRGFLKKGRVYKIITSYYWGGFFESIYNRIKEFDKVYPDADLDFGDDISKGHIVYKKGNHKVLGFPGFYQEDPRVNHEQYADYILLLQVECTNDEKVNYLGNYPNVTFFIHPDDLGKLNFDNCMINYDCN